MAANDILLKRSSVPGKQPTTSSLLPGELAVNTADGILYMGISGSVVQIANVSSSILSASFASTASYSNSPIAITGSSLYSNTLTSNVNTTNSIILGNQAGSNTTGISNSNFLGYQAGYLATGSNYANNNFIGYQAGYQYNGGGTYDGGNFLGHQAGYQANLSYNSNILGYQAGYQTYNTFNSNILGYLAGYQNSGSYVSNILGYQAGYLGVNLSYSNIFGYLAGYQASGSSQTVMLATRAGYQSSGSTFSNFIGYSAGTNTKTASYSNFIGYHAGGYTLGQYNNIIGYNAGYSITTPTIGNNNIIIGTNITLPSNYNNGINIGGLIFGSGSYGTTTGNSYSGSSNGYVGINQPNPQYTLDVNGTGNFTNGITGSLFGTASYSNQSLSSSYALTSSYANTFTVGGTLTAQTIVVQTITSSNDYITGSSINGSLLTNTHQFTGSVTITGSLAVNGNNVITANQTGSMSVATASYAISSSQAQNANTASNILGGTANYLPYWITNNSLGSSLLYQTGNTVVINQTGYTTANPEALYVWQPSSTSFNVISGKGNLNNYLQLNIQNLNNGNIVSSDIVATANNGNENNYYVDLGINGQYYDGNVGYGPGFANDGYLYNTGNNFYIGNYTSGSSTSALYLFNGYQGDHNSSFQIANNLNVYISSSLIVTGSITGLSGFTGSLQGSASYATTSSYVSYSVTSTSASYSSTASYWSGSILNATSASYSNTSSYASTASYVQNAISSSFSTSPIAITGSSIYSNALTSGVNPNNAVALGYNSGNNSIDSTAIVAFGYYAGSSLSNSSNTIFIGNQAGFQATNSNNSYFLGNYTGYRANNSPYSLFIGDSAGYFSNTSQQSIFLGINSGYKTINSYYSNFLGYNSGYQVTSSYSNLIGYQAGYNTGSLSIGNNNIIIGTNVTLSSSYSNGINIGGILFGSGTYSTTSGNPFSGSTNGKIGINQPNPQYTLDVLGSGNFTNGITGSLFGTSSYSNQSLSSSYALTASYVSGSSSNSISSSYAITSSLATNNIITASAVNTTITFTKGDGTTFNITISQSGSVASASYATFAQNATSASYASTASYVTTAQTASYYGGSVISASYASTASYVLNAISSSYSSNSTSASYASTASYVITAQTASYYGGSVTSASYASTASYVQNAVSASFAILAQTANTASYVVTAQTASYWSGSILNATSASYASTASYAPNYTLLNTFNLFSSSYSTGSFTGIFTGSHLGNLTGTASYATTASYILNAISASYATTASYSLNTQLLNNTASSVFATTGSNIFIGNQILTGSLYQSGTLYQTGNQILTGSLFTTGSNTLIGNTTLTGSLNVSGSTTQIGNNNLYGTTTLSGSIIISGSQGTLPPTVQIYGDTTHNGVIQFLPVTASINTSISASYIYVSGSTQDLYFSQNGAGYANTTRLRWIEGNLYTGLLNGGNITTQSSTVYQVSSGSGIIVNLNASAGSNPYPVVQYLNWPNLSQSIAPLSASYDQQFIAIQASGSVASIYAQGTPYYDGQFDTLIPVGLVLHQNRSTINTIKTQPSVAYGWKQRSNVFIKAFGPLKLSGFSLSPSGSSTGSLVVGAGTAYDDGANYPIDPNNPSYVSTDQGTTVSKIWRYYQSGSGWVYNTNGGAGYTTIDPTQYSNNGVLTAVPGGGANRQWSIQRCYWFPNSATKAIIVYYGNATYIDQPTAYAALNTEAFTEAPNTAANAIYLGALLVQNNANFTNSSTYAIIPSGLFRSIGGTNGGSGTIAATTLASLSDVNITEGSGIDQYALMWNNATTKWIASNNLGVSITGNAATATSASYATTSSYVLNAVSSSYATTASYWSGSILNSTSASYASTASYVTTAQTASYYGGSVTSASYAATSSYANNFTVAGTLTAQTIVVQTITSSNDYITGSSINGSLLTNTHQFTGSVTITGSLAVNGSNTILTNQTSSMSVLSSSYALTASYYGGNVTSASYSNTASYVLNAVSSSYAFTASYVLNAISSSYSSNSTSASYATTSSYVITAQTASYYGGSVTSASYASTASYVLQAVSASFTILAQTANTASYVITAQTASYYGGSVTSASYASTASYVQNAVSSSYATNATTAQTSSYANATPVTGFTIGGSQIYYANVSSPGNVNSNIFSTNTGSFTSAFYNYTVSSGSNARSGQVIAAWVGTTSSYTDFSTVDIGSTSAVTASVVIVTGQIQFNMQVPAGNWIIKSTATYL